MKTAKEVCEQLFGKVNYDANFYKQLVYLNIEFITKNSDFKNLFGSRLIGCHYLRYGMADKTDFYSRLFNKDIDEVIDAMKTITTIPSHFKVAREDINLTTFFIAHKFLNQKGLSQDDKERFAKEALNYFNYRTLVVICSNYFIYPISEEKALSLVERLSNKYLIKKLKNWNEYCQYRSQEYLKSKFIHTLKTFDEHELPNAINDLFNRTKDTIKNIYSEMIDMIEKEDYIKTQKSVVSDAEGEEVFLDKIGTPQSYFNRVDTIFINKSDFIRTIYINVVVDVIKSLSYQQLYEGLSYIYDYASMSSSHYEEVVQYGHLIIENSVDYLTKNKIYLGESTSVLSILDNIIGNLLYSRGTDLKINAVKDKGEKLLKKVFKQFNYKPGDRTLKNIRNGFFLYIVVAVILLNK